MHPKFSEFLAKLSLVQTPLRDELKLLAFEVLENKPPPRKVEVIGEECESCSA